MKSYKLPVFLLIIGAVIVITGAYFKIQGLKVSYVLLTGLIVETLAIVLFLLRFYISKK
jgi:hypothetical protein